MSNITKDNISESTKARMINDLCNDRMHYIACIAEIDKTIAYIDGSEA